MITKVAIVAVWVLDLERALDFYTNKLGFVVHTDAKMGDYRWLTLNAPEQPELEISLGVPGPPIFDAETAATVRALVAKGAMSGGVLHSRDCVRTCQELKAKGVVLTQEPIERFYGFDAAFRDDSGNNWRITQPKR